ncbi:MAG: fumarate reductase iron-sulfur subunit, partial [Gammaproteobacteria bacterium]|nr:fumarate reductase iron-sulfur subunit [Gammaproteobacteria bacterium]
MPRTLTFHIFRHNPRDSGGEPTVREYRLEEAPGMTLFIALTRIREEHDPGLSFDFVCRAGVCGSCAMLINGRPGLACRTLTSELPDTISLFPLPGFELIADLSVNTGKWMRAMSERLQAWVHLSSEVNLNEIEAAMDPDLAEAVYELDRCIECGCCVAACG